MQHTISALGGTVLSALLIWVLITQSPTSIAAFATVAFAMMIAGIAIERSKPKK